MRANAIKLTVATALALLFVVPLFAANVVTNGTMETAPLTNWPATNVTGTNTTAPGSDQKGGGTYSRKGTWQAGSKVARDW